MNRVRPVGAKHTIKIAPSPSPRRNSVPIGSVDQPSALAVNAADNFIATPTMNSRIGRAKITPTTITTAVRSRLRPLPEFARPHITPRATDPKYAARNCTANVTTSITPATKNSRQTKIAPNHPSGLFAVVRALNGSISEPVIVVVDDPSQMTTPADMPSASCVHTNTHTGVKSRPRKPRVRLAAHRSITSAAGRPPRRSRASDTTELIASSTSPTPAAAA